MQARYGYIMRVLIIDPLILYREALGQQLLAANAGVVSVHGISCFAQREGLLYNPTHIISADIKSLQQAKEKWPQAKQAFLSDNKGEGMECGEAICLNRGLCACDMLRLMGVRVQSHTDCDVKDQLIASLTRRERDVLALLARGDSNQHIAETLGISLATVKMYVRKICQKLDAENRTQAALIAYAAMHDIVWHEEKTGLVL